ncbi:MAG: carbohydrate ABC transporter permease [Planctomycetota bacterium]|nr:MAG: carbohydrate ABC transporter permease [Planctomycetota bacterium]
MSLRIWLKRIVVYGILSFGALVVLLPLFWMVLIAFKRGGYALEPELLPPSYRLVATQTFWRPKEGRGYIFFEYRPSSEDGEVHRVFVQGKFYDPFLTVNIEMKWWLDRWVAYIPNVLPGRYAYRFFINGSRHIPDPLNPPREGEFSWIEVGVGRNVNGSISHPIEIEGDRIVFYFDRRILREGFPAPCLRLDQRVLEFSQVGSKFRLMVPFPEGRDRVQVQLLYPLSFWEGVKEVYTLENFERVWKNSAFPFGSFFLNSFVVAFFSAILTVILCTFAGYAFAKKDFYGKKFLFVLFLSSMMVPGIIFMVPQFAIVNRLGWINTYQGMIVPHLANVFGLYLMRGYIEAIPHSLFEAAEIDGANEWQIFRFVLIPLCLPMMATLFLLTFVGQWSNFLWQLIVNTPDSPYRTLPVGLALFRGQYQQNWELLMAGACFSVLPIAILFLVAQRFFIEGMTRGAVKG